MIHVISPHLDDAVLSLTQTMLGFRLPQGPVEAVEIVTVFAGAPAGGRVSDYDRSCGFSSSVAAMEARRAEDRAACAYLGVGHRHLDFLDAQYGVRPSTFGLQEALRPLWAAREVVFAPLGIGHPDHALVRAAALLACPEGLGVWLYEELPYRVLNPEQAAAELDALRVDQPGLEVADVPHPWAQGARGVKFEAIGCYRSQFPQGAGDPCLLVPERTWAVAKRRNPNG